jgi:hypothetical protein
VNGIRVAVLSFVRTLQWRPRRLDSSPLEGPAVRFPAIGDRAGLARYVPRDTSRLSPDLQRAVGQVLEMCFMGLAPTGPLAGQSVYRERSHGALVTTVLIPEQDLEFIDRLSAPLTRKA